MAAYRLANVCFLVSLFSVALCNFLPSAIYCPDLEHPQYGSVKIIGKNVDGKAQYKCNNGYKLYGLFERKCLYSGVWDGSVPTCKRMFPCFFIPVALCNILPSAIYCPDLEHPQYGSVKIIGKNVDGKAEYKCNNGYKLYGSSQRKCLYSGVWDGSLPTCKRRFPLFRSIL